MSRRKPNRSPIVVEERLPERTVADWTIVGTRLRQAEPERFQQLAALAEAYVSIHERELESAAEFQARLDRIVNPTPEVN